MKKHIRAFKDYEEYKNADLVFPSVAYIEETPPEIGKKGVLYEKYEPPTIIARGTVTIPELPDGVTKEQVESMIAGQGFFIPIHLEYREAGGSGNLLDEAFIPESTRQFTSFKVNGEETLKREPVVDLGTVNPIAIEISEAAQGPLFTEESLIVGASKLSAKFSKTPYIFGLHLYLEALGGSINLGAPLEAWVTEEPLNSFLEIISDTEFNLDVKALVDLLSAELPGLDYTTVKSTLWGADEGSTIEDINSFSPTVNGYLGGSLTTGNTKMWWDSGEYEVIMKFDRNSKPCLDYLFYGNGLCLWKEIEFRGTFNNDLELPYYTWIGPKTSGTSFTTDSGSLPKESLEKVILPESLKTIKSHTFSGFTNLSVIGLPESIEDIGSSAFYDTPWYNNLYENSSDGEIYINKVLFSYKGTMPENTTLSIKKGTLGIAASALWTQTRLISVIIPDGVTCIGEGAFGQCTNLSSVTFPNSIKSVKYASFSNCKKITSIYINDIDFYIDSGIGAEIYQYSPGYNLYLNEKLVTEITIPNNITNIKKGALGCCKSVEIINIPKGVKTIGDYAFRGCSITSIVIPDSVTELGDAAFLGCSKLTNINLSPNLKRLNRDIFYNCTSLVTINIPEGVTSISTSVFENCSNLTSINIPASIGYISDYVFANCDSLNEVHITDIGSWCNIDFSTYSSSSNPLLYAHLYLNGELITNLVIPDGVKIIKDRAFRYCSCTAIYIPSSVTKIGVSSFASCANLEEINFLGGSISLDNWVFSECSKLTSISGSEFITKIGDSSFKNCTKLSSINLNNVTELGSYAFYNCYNLTSINELCEGLSEIKDYAFYNCQRLKSINIPETVTSIGADAFLQCHGLTSITIPSNVTNIKNSAFYNCGYLKSITSTASIPPTLGNNVFTFVNSSIPVYVPAGSVEAYKSASKWNLFTNIQAIS